jgi:hypothetical protein
VVKWTAERVGEPPDIPTTETGDSNVELIGSKWDPVTIDVGQDLTTVVYRASGVYTFGFVDPSKAELGAMVPPWVMRLMGKIPRAVILGGPKVVDPAGTRELRTFPPGSSVLGEWRKRQG